MGSKLPEDLKWSEAAVTLLAETEKKSCKSVCITINKACAEKDKKVAEEGTSKKDKTIAELQLAVKRLKGGESTSKDRRSEPGSDPSKDPKVIAAVLKAHAEK